MLKQACALYGQAVEAVLELESCNYDSVGVNLASNVEFDIIRPTLFLNLAAANLKLGGADECVRCCNSVIQLCNSPGLQFSSMTSAEEVTLVNHPVAEVMETLLTKALFRRGTCFEALGDSVRALEDYRSAQAVSPTDTLVKNSIISVEKRIRDAVKPVKNVTAQHVTMSAPSSSLEEQMVTNGGRCWMRRGLWSQTVNDSTVYLPIAAIVQYLFPPDGDVYAPTSHSSLKKWKIEFRCKSVTIHACRNEKTSDLNLDLSHHVISSECVWTLDLSHPPVSRSEAGWDDAGVDRVLGPKDTDPGPNSCAEGYLVLHLSKRPCSEWLPGQEVGRTWTCRRTHHASEDTSRLI